MNIHELDNCNLTEIAKYKDSLNPTVWDRHEKLTNAVKDVIMVGLDEYCEYLGLSESQIKDVVVAGKQASYDYSSKDSLDVVVVADLNADSTFREFFNENQYKFNGQRQVAVSGHAVNFYVQPSDEPFVSRGAYSVLSESWVQVPVRRAVQSTDTVKLLKESEQRAQPVKRVVKQKKKVVENKQPVVYGYGPEQINEVSLTPDGVSQYTKMFLSEEPSDEEILSDFINFCSKSLELENTPDFRIRRDPEWSRRNKTFGKFNHETGVLEVSVANRHIMDTLRTVAHELAHQRQSEVAEMPDGAGDTGSDHENEANAVAGILMREYGRSHPDLFASEDEITESASGYIPTKKQAKDPRFSMALTADIKPGALGKNANKLKLNTDSQGRPQVANPNGKFEAMMEEYRRFKLDR